METIKYRFVGKLHVTLLLALQLLFLDISHSQSATVQNSCVQVLQSELKLAPLEKRHHKSLAELYYTEDVQRFFLGNANVKAKIKSTIERVSSNNENKRMNFDGYWAIEVGGEFAGVIMLTAVEPEMLTPEHAVYFRKSSSKDLYLIVGYALKPEFRGQGIALRSLNSVVKIAKAKLRAKYVFASTNRLNEPSINVLSRAGFEVFPTSDTKRVKFYKPLQN